MEIFSIIGRYNNLDDKPIDIDSKEKMASSLTKTMSVQSITLLLPSEDDGDPNEIPSEQFIREQEFPTVFHLLNHAADLGVEEVQMVNPMDENTMMAVLTPDGFRYDTDAILEMATNEPEEFLKLSATNPAEFVEKFKIPADGVSAQAETKTVTRLSEEEGMDNYLDDQEGREAIDAQLNAIFDEIGILVN